MIQVLASEDGIKSVSQARVVDLLDTIEKWVKKKEVSVIVDNLHFTVPQYIDVFLLMLLRPSRHKA